MVVIAGERADESFIEGFAVLFVPFDCGYDHLKARGNGEKTVKSQSRIWAQRNVSVSCVECSLAALISVVCPRNKVLLCHKSMFAFPKFQEDPSVDSCANPPEFTLFNCQVCKVFYTALIDNKKNN